MTEKAESSRILLGKIASLTSIRDIDIFEFSFLQTLSEILSAREVCIYKFNNTQESCHLLRYASEIEKGEAKSKSEKPKEVQITDVEIPEDIKQAQAWIELNDKVYSIMLAIYLLIYIKN